MKIAKLTDSIFKNLVVVAYPEINRNDNFIVIGNIENMTGHVYCQNLRNKYFYIFDKDLFEYEK